MRIDAHQHFWRYTAREYRWIKKPLAALRRDFLPGDLQPLLARSRLDGCIAVQARQSLEETRWLLELAAQHPWIFGVVGWLDLRSSKLEAQLEEFAGQARLVGVRHVLQDESKRFLGRRDFGRGLALLERHELVYELLIHEGQLPAAVELVRRHPGVQFVLDHLAKPPVKKGKLEPWATQLRELARAPNVAAKVSGLVTEADWPRWNTFHLQPYLESALEAFGIERVLFGSDWPVCLLAASYERWFEVVEGWVALLSPGEQAAILGRNAARLYNLELSER